MACEESQDKEGGIERVGGEKENGMERKGVWERVNGNQKRFNVV